MSTRYDIITGREPVPVSGNIFEVKTGYAINVGSIIKYNGEPAGVVISNERRNDQYYVRIMLNDNVDLNDKLSMGSL